ncbi:Golgi-associated olfactory signaling regulator [Paroedura picta]|uniref:Golgi-associated olfactory signaling regulator n=1 Tax=Paroedura picta TaxID=143630 RepID=UPI004055D6E1
MDRYYLLWGLLLTFRTSYSLDSATPSPSLPSSPSSFPTTPQSPPESTPDTKSLLASGPDTTPPPDPSLPQQNQTQPVFPTKQTPRARLSLEKSAQLPFKFPVDTGRHDSGASQRWVAAAGGVEIVLMEPKGRLPMREPQGTTNHAMGLFLGGCGLLLCLFIGIYCTYSRGAKKEPFSHHRLYDDGFDDPALFLDNPKDYDWFFYETDGYVYPTPSQTLSKPIQTLSIPALKQPASALEMPPGNLEASEVTPDTKPPSPKLECLSPANLQTGNFI